MIHGGKPLRGSVSPSGSKNASVAILPAALLSEEKVAIENLPDIRDVHVLENILRALGARIEYSPGQMTVDSRSVESCVACEELTSQMRASYYLLGAMLGRFGEARIAMPGGCKIGARPIDQHLKGMEALGADIELTDTEVIARAHGGRLKGAEVYFDIVSVGATANVLMAAARAVGRTTIVNAAKEPHIVDLANFLNSMGANIKGAGTDVIRVNGVDSLHASTYAVIPDQIETGTFMIAGAATGGDVTVTNVIPTHMESMTAKLEEMGVFIEEGEDSIRVVGTGRHRGTSVRTMPYPGFPTDLMQPLSALMALATTRSRIEENIFENRFMHFDALRSMGAQIRVIQPGRVAEIDGVPKLHGAEVIASDLRAGAALVIAGLAAEGETLIGGLTHIDRGYDHLEDKMRALGADIQRIRR
ncbi:MAG: UDP-N-acetylglucosamine 1-carboxyvinyltransferase [Clostridia bacterium]|nr:UDP-N-acetylglucosamine 1-carboxyvinyltransferase [Clostridia bacterium]